MGLVATLQHCWVGERQYEECLAPHKALVAVISQRWDVFSPSLLGSVVSFLTHNTPEMDGEEELMGLQSPK